MGWGDLSNETKITGRNIRQIKQSPKNSTQEPQPIDRQPRAQRWRELHNQVLTPVIPRAAIQRKPASTTKGLIHSFQKHSPRENIPDIPNTQIPSPAPRGGDNPFLPQNSR